MSMENHRQPPEGLTVEKAAQLTGTKPANIYRAIKRKRIRAKVVLGEGAQAQYRVDHQSLLEWRDTWEVRRMRGEKQQQHERAGRRMIAATN